jgi:mannose-6-phosphate isomerase-like protein (cupin superfamily)
MIEKAIFSKAENVDWFEPWPGEKIAMRVESWQTGNAFSLTEAIVGPQVGPPLHVHLDADEVFYVLEGIVDFVCENERFRTGPGGLVVIPRGARHAFRNFEDTPARALVLLSPGGFEQLMREMIGRPPTDLPAIGAKYHMEIVGPPMSAA